MELLKAGYQLELYAPGTVIENMEDRNLRYESMITEVVNQDLIDISLPICEGNSLITKVGDHYDAYFFIGQKVYQCNVQVEERISQDDVVMLRMRCNNPLMKYERRWHNRLKCHTKMRYLLITGENAQAFRDAVRENKLLEMEGFKEGITLDVSGGGIRFCSSEELPLGGMVITNFTIEEDGSQHVFVAKVLHSTLELEQEGMFEQRLQYVDMKGNDKDKMLSYLYEKELEKKKTK